MAAVSMSRRTIALIAAVVLAAVATVALVSYIQGVRDDAKGEGTLVPVFVAKDTIPPGKGADAAISEGLIDQVNVQESARVVGTIQSLTEIQGLIAAAAIFPNEQIVTGQFVEAAQAVQSGLDISGNQMAVSFEVGIVPGVANFLNPGDRISILAQMNAPGGGGGGASGPRVQFLLQNVLILQIGTRTFTEEGADTVRRGLDNVVLTVSLNGRFAEKLVFAKLNGQLYLTLLPEGARPQNTPGRTIANAFAN